MEKDLNQEIINLNKEIKELQNTIDEKEMLRKRLQAEVEETTRETTKNTLDLGKMIMAINNLHERCKMDNKVKIHIHHNEYEEKK